MNTPISEAARAVTRKLYPELCTGLSDDLVEFVNIAHMVQEALDSAQPVEGKTPETDNCLSELSARLKKAEELLKKAVNYDAPMDAVHKQITTFLNQPKP